MRLTTKLVIGVGIPAVGLAAWLAFGITVNQHAISPADPEIGAADPLAPEIDQARALMQGIRHALSRDNGASVITGTADADKAWRYVFLSASREGERARVATGQGQGLLAAIDAAVSSLRVHDGMSDPRWLRLDIVAPAPQASVVRPSLDGAAYPRRSGLALLPVEVLAGGLAESEGLRWNDYLDDHLWSRLPMAAQAVAGRLSLLTTQLTGTGVPVSPFETRAIFDDGGRVFMLYRGQRLREPLDVGTLMAAARDAGDYLQRATAEDGRFVYSYSPGRDRVNPGYNLVRHAGTIYAMLELHEIEAEAALLEDARRAIDYLSRFIVDFGDPAAQISALAGEGKIKLGGVALTIVALAKYTEATGDGQYLPLMRRLANYLLDAQREDGSFVSQRYYPSGEERTDFVSAYYPGEAILGLMRLYQLDPDEAWLDAAARAADYLINVRDAGLETDELNHDHWLLYALNELYRARPAAHYLDHAMRITNAIIGGQTRYSSIPDYAGSYYNPPRSTPTAVRTEGLLAALALAEDFKRFPENRLARAAIERGLQFQLQTRITPEKAMFFPRPDRALGGFHASLTDFEIRIDYVQHNLSALLGYARWLKAEKN